MLKAALPSLVMLLPTAQAAALPPWCCRRRPPAETQPPAPVVIRFRPRVPRYTLRAEPLPHPAMPTPVLPPGGPSLSAIPEAQATDRPRRMAVGLVAPPSNPLQIHVESPSQPTPYSPAKSTFIESAALEFVNPGPGMAVLTVGMPRGGAPGEPPVLLVKSNVGNPHTSELLVPGPGRNRKLQPGERISLRSSASEVEFTFRIEYQDRTHEMHTRIMEAPIPGGDAYFESITLQEAAKPERKS